MRPNSPYSTRAAGMSRRMTSILLTLAAMVTEEFAAQSLTGSRNLPRSGLKPGKDVGEVKAAKDDGRLPMEDHNTRIIVFGRDGVQAKAVAEAIAQEAFHNVAYFGDTFETLMQQVAGE